MKNNFLFFASLLLILSFWQNNTWAQTSTYFPTSAVNFSGTVSSTATPGALLTPYGWTDKFGNNFSLSNGGLVQSVFKNPSDFRFVDKYLVNRQVTNTVNTQISFNLTKGNNCATYAFLRIQNEGSQTPSGYALTFNYGVDAGARVPSWGIVTNGVTPTVTALTTIYGALANVGATGTYSVTATVEQTTSTSSTLFLSVSSGGTVLWKGSATDNTLALQNVVGSSAVLYSQLDATNYITGITTYNTTPPTYTLTGPSTAVVGSASSNFSVKPSSAFGQQVTITPSDGGAGGTFTPTSLTYTASSVATQTFTYTPNITGAITISTTCSLSAIPNPSSIILNSTSPTYTLTGPSSAIVGIASSNYIVTPAAAFGRTVVITPSDGGAGGTFSPSSLTFIASSVASQTFTYTPNITGYITISTTSNYSFITNPASLILNSSSPSSYSLTGPSTAVAGSATSNFTVTPAAAFGRIVNIYPVDGGAGGTFSPSTLTYSAISVTPQTFTYTPARAGTITVSTNTDYPQITNPPSVILNSASPTYTLTGPSTAVAGSASTNFIVTPAVAFGRTVVITPSDGSAGGTFSPSTITYSASSVASQTFTYTPIRTGTITVTTNSDYSFMINPSSIILNSTSPPSYTLTGPIGAVVGSASNNFSVKPISAFGRQVIITPSDGGAGGSFTPATITYTASSVATQTFTYTPVRTGTISVTTNTDFSLIPNPSSITLNSFSNLTQTYFPTSKVNFSGSVSSAATPGALLTPYGWTDKFGNNFSLSNGGLVQSVFKNPGDARFVDKYLVNRQVTNTVNTQISFDLNKGNNCATYAYLRIQNEQATPSGYALTFNYGVDAGTRVPSWGIVTNGVTPTVTALTTIYGALANVGATGTYSVTATVEQTTSTSSTLFLSVSSAGTVLWKGAATDATPALQNVAGSSAVLYSQLDATNYITGITTYNTTPPTYTFTGPSTAENGIASSNFTITPRAAFGRQVTITPSSGSAGGTFSPSSLTFSSNTTTAQTFTYTPSRTGTITITTISDYSSMTNPAGITLNSVSPSSYTLTGPSTVVNGTTSTNFTVTPRAAFGSSIVITPSDGGIGGTFAPASLSFNASSVTPQSFTYTPNRTGSITIATISDVLSITNASSLNINSLSPTSYTLTGPSTAVVGTSTTDFIVTPNDAFGVPVIITPSDGAAGGTFIPASLTFDAISVTPQTFTYTPSQTGSITINTVSDFLSMANPSSIIVNSSANTAPVSISVLDPNIIWSPGSWDFITPTSFTVYNTTAANAAQSANSGAYLKATFANTTQIIIKLDPSTLGSVNYPPVIMYNVDGIGVSTSGWKIVKLNAGTSTISITGLTLGTHTLDLRIGETEQKQTLVPNVMSTNRFSNTLNTSASSILRITGFQLSAGGSIVSTTARPKKMIMFGDSITEGIGSDPTNTFGQNTNSGYTASAQAIASGLNAEFGQIGFGSQGYEVPGSANYCFHSSTVAVTVGDQSATYQRTWDKFGVGRPRSLTGFDYILNMHATNDWHQNRSATLITADATDWITKVRAVAGPNTWIFLINAPCGNQKPEFVAALKTAVDNYKSAYTGDTKVAFIDVSDVVPGIVYVSPGVNSADGTHPYWWYNREFGAAVANAITATINNATSTKPAFKNMF